DRYFSLRTEFDDYKWKDTLSQNDYSVDNLKPYYDLLGLTEDASVEEIKQAYHELALQHHPDLPKNASRIEECEELMMKINEAYERLRR
ncbi:MAG: DnaJ domain-containing protein, partial [Paludibacteraceae bacterium]|nr:DnaJ domain-containing protein [Paludibacteraceae bacterium]